MLRDLREIPARSDRQLQYVQVLDDSMTFINRLTKRDSASAGRKGQKRRQTGNICVGNVARTNPFHSRLHFHFLQLRNITRKCHFHFQGNFHTLNINLRLRSLAAVVVVDEVGSLPRQLALMETGANYDLMFSKNKMITHISLTELPVRSSRMFSKKKILFPPFFDRPVCAI